MSAKSKTLSVSLLMLAVILRLAAATGVKVHGTVVDVGEAVIPNATVELYSYLTDTDRVTQTDSNGSFEFTAIRPGVYELQVSARAFCMRFERVLVGSTNPAALSIVLSVGTFCDDCDPYPVEYFDADGRTALKGIVVGPVNVGVALARVFVGVRPDDNPTASVRTNQRGEFRFTKLRPGHYSVRASRGEYVSKEITSLRVKQGKTASIKILVTNKVEVCQ